MLISDYLLAAYAWNVHVHIQTPCVATLVCLNVQLYSVFVNAWPTRAHRTPYDYTDSQFEDEQKEEPVVERRRSSLSELGIKLTSLILPLKTLVQPNSHRWPTAAPLSARKAKRLAA